MFVEDIGSPVAIATRGQIEGDGFDRQREKIQKWPKSNGQPSNGNFGKKEFLEQMKWMVSHND